MRWPFRAARVPPPVPAAAPAPVRREPKINLSALAATAAPAARPAQCFAPAAPMPGVLPAGTSALAMDDAFGSAGYGFSAQGYYSEGLAWLGYPYLAELAQRAEYRRMSEVIAKEMTRKWIRLHGANDDADKDKIKRLGAAMRRFKVQDAFRRASEIDGFFGRSHIFPDFGVTDDGSELQTPLFIDKRKIKPGSLKRLVVIEPMWTYPANYNSTDPLRGDFYKPVSWYVMGKTVHASRLMTLIAREMPDMLKPAYSFGGLSLTQMAKPYVDNWLRTRQSVSDLLHSFSVSGIKTNMSADLQNGDGSSSAARAQLFNQMRDNRGMLMLDKDTEEFFNVSTPLGTLDHLQAQSQEHMASVSGIPLVKLLGITPSGLNASSDGEIRVFYDWIEAQQEDLFTEPLKRVLDIIQLSEFGEIDPAITFTFESLWSLDDAAKAAIRKTNADTAAVSIESGVLSPGEERKRLADEDGGLYTGIDVNDLPDPPEADADHEPINGDPAASARRASIESGGSGV